MRRKGCFGAGVVDCFSLKYNKDDTNCVSCKWMKDCISGVLPCDNCEVTGCEENVITKIVKPVVTHPTWSSISA